MQAKRCGNAPTPGSGEALLTIKEARRLVNIGTTNFYSLIRNVAIHGKPTPTAFYHPSTVTSEGFLEEFSQGKVTFSFEVDRGQITDELRGE